MRTPCSSARRRHCRSRSTKPCSTTACSTSRSTPKAQASSASCSSSRTASSSSATSARAGRPGIALAGIDLEAFALLRALGAPSDRDGSALVAVAIGHDRSTFAVSDGRICEFTRVVEWGGCVAERRARARVRQHAVRGRGDQAAALARDGARSPKDLTAEQTAHALDAVRRQVQSFARELVSSLQFYQNQPGSLGIGEIVLTGGTAQLPGLAEELERLIGVHVRVGDPLARAQGSRSASRAGEQLGSLAVAIGLGIED